MKKYQLFYFPSSDAVAEICYKNEEEAVFFTMSEARAYKEYLQSLHRDVIYTIEVIDDTEDKEAQMYEDKRHKWADVIIAFAEGKQVQFHNPQFHKPGQWSDSSNLEGITTNHLQWRIKPEKKRGWLMIGKVSRDTHVYDVKQTFTHRSTSSFIAQIEIEYEEGEGLD